MKKLQWLSLFGMICMGLFTFSACGDDEEEAQPGETSELATKILGSWYFVEEQSSEKVMVCWMSFGQNGTGVYGEAKAKAKNNWQVESQSLDINWTLSGNHLTMVGSKDGESLKREGDVKDNGDGTFTVTRYLDDDTTDKVTICKMNGQTAETILSQLLQGKEPGEDVSKWAQMIVGYWYTTYADVSYVDETGKQLSHTGTVNKDKEEDWPFYNAFYFGADGSFDGWAINYNGDEGYYGTWDETQLGKYRFDPETKIATLYDLIMGHHQVEAYRRGQTDLQTIEMTIHVQSLTENELVFYIEGMGTYKMAKGEAPEVNPDPEPNPDIAAKLLGTWKTISITGTATDVESGRVVEKWDNHPTFEDAQNPEKESLKYMEFTFGEGNAFMLQQFNEETRQFSDIMQGSWFLEGNSLRAVIGDFEKNVEIVELTDDKLVTHETRIEEGFRSHETQEEYTVTYDETIYFTRK